MAAPVSASAPAAASALNMAAAPARRTHALNKAPISAASAVTIGRMYRSSLVPENEKNTTMATIQISNSLAAGFARSRMLHQSAAGMNKDHGNRSANITGM